MPIDIESEPAVLAIRNSRIPVPPMNAANIGDTITTRALNATGPDPGRALDAHPEKVPVATTDQTEVPKYAGCCYLGIDNGLTGAMAFLSPDDHLICHPVLCRDLGKERLLDVSGNQALVRSFLERIPGLGKILIVYEQSPITPVFGVKNNYVNGRNNEFWRVLLTLEKIPFAWVNPRSWQKDIFRGIRGKDTKQMARLVVEQRFPQFRCPGLNKSQVEGVNDAICIALWSRQNLK